MSGKELIKASRQLLSNLAELPAHLSSRGGSVAVPPPSVVTNPLARVDGASVRGYPGEVGEAGLSEIGWTGPPLPPLRRSSGSGVGLLVSIHSLVGGGPSKGDAVSSASDLVGEVYHCAGQGLCWAAVGVLCPGDRCLGVREDRIAPAALAAGVKEPDGLEDRENLRVENLLISAQESARTSPPALPPPNRRRFDLSTLHS